MYYSNIQLLINGNLERTCTVAKGAEAFETTTVVFEI